MVIWIILSDEKFICVVFSLWQGEVLISPSRRFLRGANPSRRFGKKITAFWMLIQTLAGENDFSEYI